MRRRCRRRSGIEVGLGVGAWLAALGACITAPGTRKGEIGKPIVEFPSPAALSEIQRRPAVVPSVPGGEIPTEGWQLDAPIDEGATAHVPASDLEPWQPRGPWETAFASESAARSTPPRLTQALSCAAREIGRYYLKTQKQVPDLLERYLLAACDAVVPTAGFLWISSKVPGTVNDQQLLDRWRPQLKTDLLDHLPREANVAGFWYGRQGQEVVAVMAYARPRAKFTTLSLVPDAQGNLLYEGQLEDAADYIEGFANRGKFGVDKCQLDPAIPRPRFRAICHAAPDDATTWIDLVFAPPKRVLASAFASILARRSAAEPRPFSQMPYGNKREATSSETFASALHQQLNDVRALAGLPPVRLSAGETAKAAALAAHYFAGDLAEHGSSEEPERIALGLLAGWQLGGTIRDGHFFSGVALHTRDVGMWLSHAMMTPLGRVTLMAPDIEEISLGPLLLTEPQGLAAVVTGFSLYHGDDHTGDINQLYARLLTARARLSLKLPKRLNGMDRVLAQELAHVRDGSMTPMQALNVALEDGSFRFSSSMRGYILETTSLDALEIPEDIIRRPNLMLEIGVAHYKPPGAAWGQMIILVVYIEEGNRLQTI